MKTSSPIPTERIERSIYLIRGEKVMLDSDLAALYGVTTARLNQQANRNIERFPEDFMFQLTNEEFKGGVAGGNFRSSSLSTVPSWRPTFSTASGRCG